MAVYLVVLTAVAYISVHPIRTPLYLSAMAMGAPQQDIELLADGFRLKAWWVHGPVEPNLPLTDDAPVVILAHGYMMSRSEVACTSYHLWRNGISSLSVDMRAHGRSEGKTCTLGVREKAEIKAAVAWVKEKRPHAQIGLLGSSMGGAACAFALADEPDLADWLVLDSVYSSLASASMGWWSLLGVPGMRYVLSPILIVAWPMVGFNPFKVDVANALRKIGPKPVLMLHGDRDCLAIPAQAERNLAVVQAHNDPTAEIVWFDECDHCEAIYRRTDVYIDHLIRFIKRQSPSAAPDALVISK